MTLAIAVILSSHSNCQESKPIIVKGITSNLKPTNEDIFVSPTISYRIATLYI